MVTRPMRLLRGPFTQKSISTIPVHRFSTTKKTEARNRCFTPVRRPDEFQSYLALSTSARMPLITFWTASYCSTCRTVSPTLQELIQAGIGEEEGGVSFCEVEYDSQDIMNSGLGMTYMITSIPTLLSFDRGEAQTDTKVTDPKLMADPAWLENWTRAEARRQGGGGGGEASIGEGLFGGLFRNHGNKR